MAMLKKVAAPVRTVVAPAKAATKVAPKAVAPKTIGGFTVLKGIDIPAKRAFGKRGVYNDMFAQLEVGDCLEIQVEEDKTNISKMNGLYNAARRNGASIVIRVHDAGTEGHGGVLRMWYNGQKEEETA